MTETRQQAARGRSGDGGADDWKDFEHTGPGTLAGRYMRRFWQPVYLAEDLPPGRAKPLRVMSEDFTLYRGESGLAHVVAFRCAHRGTQLSVGWVEGDNLRCFYHGWMYGPDGQCVEQPAEPEPFAQKVQIRSYPTEEYLGLIFVFLGEGDPPPLPRYPQYEQGGLVLNQKHLRGCNYFQNLENDPVHGAFVHARGRKRPIPVVTAQESAWGVTAYSTYPGGSVRTTQWGLPDMHLVTTPPSTRSNLWRDALSWFVPVDDYSHIDIRMHYVRVTDEESRRTHLERRAAREAIADETYDPAKMAQVVLAGKMHISDFFDKADQLIEDDVAQIGQGLIADRSSERLGRSDANVIMIRKLWEQELRALSEDRPLREWRFSEETMPRDDGGLRRNQEAAAAAR